MIVILRRILSITGGMMEDIAMRTNLRACLDRMVLGGLISFLYQDTERLG